MTLTAPQRPVPEAGAPPQDIDQRFEEISRDLSSYRISRDGWTILVFALAAAAAIFSIVGMGLALRNDGGGGGAAAAPTIDANLTEFAIELSSAQIGAGGTITVHTGGTTAHDLAIRQTDLTTGSIDPGGSATLDVSDLEPGTYELICTIPGHVGSGMSTTLVIGDGATAAAAGAHTGHDSLTPEQGAIQDAAMIESVMEFPAATEGHGPNHPRYETERSGRTRRRELRRVK